MTNDNSYALAKVLDHYGIDYSQKKIICPFHEDANPSMIIDVLKNRWYCFGCGLSGDAERFVKLIEKKYNGVNDLAALKLYKDILRERDSKDYINTVRRNLTPQKQNRELYAISYDYYHGLRTVDWKNPYCEEAEEALEYMKGRGFDYGTLNLCGAKVTFERNYQIVFPMMDNGKFRGWVSRTMDSEIEKKRKYLYNEGFRRSTTLVGDYGLERTGLDFVYVVEGYMDRLKLVQFGIKNVVAILGWKMSAEQEKKLRDSGVKYIICATDNDEAGRKGYRYLRTRFDKDVFRFRYLKGIKDPGDMNKDTFNKMNNKTMEEFKNGTVRQD